MGTDRPRLGRHGRLTTLRAFAISHDDMVLEAAVNGQADAIATFNRRDLARPASRFDIPVLTPAEALRRWETTR